MDLILISKVLCYTPFTLLFRFLFVCQQFGHCQLCTERRCLLCSGEGAQGRLAACQLSSIIALLHFGCYFFQLEWLLDDPNVKEAWAAIIEFLSFVHDKSLDIVNEFSQIYTWIFAYFLMVIRNIHGFFRKFVRIFRISL